MALRRALAVLAIAVCSSSAFADTPVTKVTASDASAPAEVALTDEALAVGRETFTFQAEVSRLMDIIINSLYTKKEVFLREIISNAADALDKIRFLSLSDDTLLGTGETRDLEIRIIPNKAERTLTIADRGVGMTKADLINNLGTVARSGTAAFMEQLSSGGDLNLIGQFGVGFYSVYLVADKVRVVTKNNDDKQYVWESSAEGSYTVTEDPRGNTLGRGTEITLFLKDDALDYANQDSVKTLIKKYSEFITFPISLRTSTMEKIEVPIVEEEAEKAEGEEDVVAEDEAKDAKPKFKTEEVEKLSWSVVNEQKAVWSRAVTDVTDEEYTGFYKAISKDVIDPMTWIHFRGEGEVEFKAILFVPGTAPSDQYDNYYGKKSALRLYVRKVLISDEFEEMIPRYLNFIRGVVDSDDLPLNVSREQLQQAKILKVVAKKLVRKALEMLRKLAMTEKKAIADKEAKESGTEAADKEAASGEEETEGEGKGKEFVIPSHLLKNAETCYSTFWDQFGKNIKLGIIEDTSNKSKLAKLLRFKSTTSGKDGRWRSLEEYVKSMKEGQKQIYYIAGESVEDVMSSPFLERLTAKGLEVLFLTDPIDEYTIQNLPEFDGRKIQSITKEGLVLPNQGDDEKRRETLYKTDFEPLTKYLKGVYGDKVEKVTVSSRLAGSPCVLVTSQYGNSANMERIMRAQAFADPSRASVMASKKTLEINPRHPIITELKARAAAGTADAQTADIASLLYDTALLNSGFAMDDSRDFATRMYRLMKSGLALESLELVPEMELPPVEPEVVVEEEEDDGEAAAAEEL